MICRSLELWARTVLGKDHRGSEGRQWQRGEEGMDTVEISRVGVAGFSVPGDGGNETEGEIQLDCLVSG